MKKYWFLIALAVCIIIAFIWGVTISHTPIIKDKLGVHFIDVGQGDSVLVVSESGKAILIDGGPESAGDNVCNYLHSQHIRTLDAIILCQSREDHLGGLFQVIRSFSVRKVYGVPAEGGSRLLAHFRDKLKQRKIPFEPVASSETLVLDKDSRIQFNAPLFPPIDRAGFDSENNSVVLRIVCKKVSYLLMGDLQREGIDTLLNNSMLQPSQVLMISDHGNLGGTTDALLQTVTPQWGIISVGAGNSQNDPSPETLARLNENDIRVLRTDLQGNIILTTDGKQIHEITEN